MDVTRLTENGATRDLGVMRAMQLFVCLFVPATNGVTLCTKPESAFRERDVSNGCCWTITFCADARSVHPMLYVVFCGTFTAQYPLLQVVLTVRGH